MSMPIIQTPENPIGREQSVSNLIESVALMEAGLSHIINAEGEKIQKVVDPDADYPLTDIIEVNNSAEKMINTISKLEMMLQSKLEASKDLEGNGTVGPTGPTGPTGPVGVAGSVYSLSTQNINGSTLDFTVNPTLTMPLPDISYINGFTANETNNEFTVQNTGSYLIIYSVSADIAVGTALDAGIAVNNTVNPNTVTLINLGNGGATHDTIISLNANDVIKLNLTTIINPLAVALVATLSVIKIA